MEVYAEPGIELATSSLRGDTVGAQLAGSIADKENLRPCGFVHSSFSEPAEGKARVQTRSVLADVTHRFPGDSTAFQVPPEGSGQVQNSNAARPSAQELARNATAAASRLRRMR